MTYLFLRFYVGVLIVLSLAWYIHSLVLNQRSAADLSRVILEAHSGGARLAANEIASAAPDQLEEAQQAIQSQFAYPVQLITKAEDLRQDVKARLATGDDVVHFSEGASHFVLASCCDGKRFVRLGPMPSYRRQEIEDSIGGWMKMVAQQLQIVPADERKETAKRIEEQHKFQVPFRLVRNEDLSPVAKRRMIRGDEIVFFAPEEGGADYFSAVQLSDQSETVVFGPFPSFERIEQKAATTTLALVLLPAALAIAFLLRPVASQLRHVEKTAEAIASGDLEARVDENRVSTARQLALSFNLMADRNESLLRSQRELLQAVSHELRTPLARIQFASELIETAKTPEERSTRIRAVEDASAQLDGLVSELLAYVRAESESRDSENELLPFTPLVSDIFEQIETLYPHVNFTIAGNEELSIDGNRRGLRRAIGNLVLNAARFANDKVSVEVNKSQDGVHLFVDDDGPGIPANERERVFEPFVRLDNNAANKGVGSGLGLALVQRIIRQQRGNVHVEEAPIGGARFVVFLPIATERT